MTCYPVHENIASSDKQLLNKIVEAVKGLSSIQSIQNFREIDLDPFMKNSPLVNKYGADSRYVTITMNTSKDASMDTKRAGDMLKAVFPLSQNIESVDITFMGAARNNLGNTVDTSWVTVDMSRNLYKQIDWANLDYQSLPSIIKAANEKDLLGDPADVDADFYDINTRVQ